MLLLDLAKARDLTQILSSLGHGAASVCLEWNPDQSAWVGKACWPDDDVISGQPSFSPEEAIRDLIVELEHLLHRITCISPALEPM